MAARRSRRPPAAALARRWLAVIMIGLIGYAYYHPLRSWVETRDELSSRRAEVAQLAAEKRALLDRLAASTSADALAREARRLGYVRPGEHLFIVKGIAAWKKAHGTTIDGDGK
jgi:cell division protein FtsB